MSEKEYQVALSFAGENRDYVEEVANILKGAGVSVFYDKMAEATLWGKDLYTELTDVYKNKCLYTVMFISKQYSEKLWTNHERRAAQARAFKESMEYILPARFDDTEIPGVLSTVGYIDLTKRSPNELADLIIEKLISDGQSIPTSKMRSTTHQVNYVSSIDATNATVLVKDNEGIPIKGVTVTAICDNGTHKETKTKENGEAVFSFQVKRMYTLLISTIEYPAVIHDNWNISQNIEVLINKTDATGSIICHSTCHIPGLKGRLNIIQDTSYRLYLYADNIAINGGLQQPASFELNKPFKLEDSNGVIMAVTVKYIKGQTSLVEFVCSN